MVKDYNSSRLHRMFHIHAYPFYQSYPRVAHTNKVEEVEKNVENKTSSKEEKKTQL